MALEIEGGLFKQSDVRETTPNLIKLQADLDFNSNKGTNCTDPTLNQDVATKKYVDDNIPADTNSQMMGGNIGERFFNNGEQSFWPIMGGFPATEYATPIEAEANIIFPIAGTLQNFFTFVNTNAIDSGGADSLTITIRKNGVSQSIETEYATTETGQKSDTINTTSVAAGDRISILIVSFNDGTSSAREISWGCEFSPS